MQEAVNDERLDLAVKSQTEPPRVACGRLDRNHHIAEMAIFTLIPCFAAAFVIGEREHIGRRVNPAIVAVELPHQWIANESDRGRGIRASDASEPFFRKLR